ncbi:DnaD domain protein [Bacillus cytotoxicus]|uniref:DnaD domain-containing protein n=1 Tax=Bacillus cereus group TaxID=86661 RepID=UPI001F588D69|nr:MULTISPECIES: DnaD domain protein [Bacillus cereus group]MDH2866777.1 DnaD domain protein [Bacillus cytotoxicus]
MNFQHEVFDIIATFSGQANKIVINTAFVDFVEDLEIGLFLSQLIYWSDRTTRPDGYFYKSDKEWHEEIRISKYAVRKSRKKLEEMGLLQTFVKKANGSPTVHYKLDKRRFSEMFISFLRNRKNEISKSQNPFAETETSLTDITTDITTHIDDADKHPLIDEEFQKSYNYLLQNNIPLSETAMQDLGEFCDVLGSQIIMEAVDRAIDQNAKRWKYISGILFDWQKNNVKTLADVIKLDEDYKNRRGGVGNAAHRKRTGRGYAASRNYEEENANRKRNMPSFIKRV